MSIVSCRSSAKWGGERFVVWHESTLGLSRQGSVGMSNSEVYTEAK